MKVELRALDPKSYTPHLLHKPERAWPETNCYTDLWIEILNGLGFEPRAALPFTLGLDFEGDQWTFFKFPLSDLLELYGADVQELSIWKPVRFHCEEQLRQGRLTIVEMDSFYLPDTRGTAYQHEHVKTSIGVNAIDLEKKTLGYFHNAGYYELSGDDFDGVFRLTKELSENPNILPPYVELVKWDMAQAKKGPALLAASKKLLREHLARRPKTNPITRYRPRFAEDMEWLKTQPLSQFHLYSFATLRQIGASFELLSDYVKWLTSQGEAGLETAATSFETIANTAKALQFKVARAVNTKKAQDYSAGLDALESNWASGLQALDAYAGRG